MQGTGQQLESEEISRIFAEIIQKTLEAYNQPIREKFKKMSRAEQLGYDVTRILLRENIVRPGEAQEKMDVKKAESKDTEK